MGMVRGNTFLDGTSHLSGVSRNSNLTRTKTLDYHGFNMLSERAVSQMSRVPQKALTLPGPRPSSESDRDYIEERLTKSEVGGLIDSQPRQMRVPILGPTRQQTETYLFKMAKKKLEKLEQLRQSVIPIDGPANHLAIGGRLISGDIAVFEDNAANAVLLDAESQHKSGYPTIATSSMVARRNRVSVIPDPVDNQSDMRFFSELVKPIQYRWKFQKDKLKTLTPSKHGFHQRSQSPTFQRLIEANEKLQDIAGQDVDDISEQYSKDFIETQSELNGYLSGVKVQKVNRNTKSEPSSNRPSYAGSLPATSDITGKRDGDLKPEIRTIDPPKKEKESVIHKEREELPPRRNPPVKVTHPKPPPPVYPVQQPSKTSQHHEIKVDFKKHDSHSELHLFLPHIHDTHSRGGTPEDQHRKYRNNFELPPIDDYQDVKTMEEDKYKYRKKITSANKVETKKKKKHTRIKSSKEDREVMDILNDVPTLISLESDKDYHPESMCVFEHCALHKHRKSTRIRQA